MSHFSYSVACLSEQRSSWVQLQGLLSSVQTATFSVTWVELGTADFAWSTLPVYDLYFCDAPLLFLLEQHDFIAQNLVFWIAETATAQTEILQQGVTDCFVRSELTTGLLEHCLRLCLRQRLPLRGQDASLMEFQGDRFQTLINNIPGVVYRCLLTTGWHGAYFSESIETLVGYPAGDFAAGGDRPFATVIHPADRDFVEQVVNRKIQDKKPFILEYRIIHRDGTVKWVEDHGQGVFDAFGQLLWLDGVIIDISEKKAIAKELNQQAMNSYEKTPAMLQAVDTCGKLVALSDRWLQKMGYTRPEILGRQATDFFTEASRQAYRDYVLPILAQMGVVEEIELQLINRTGGIIDVLLSAIAETSGGVTRYLAVLTDVTTRNKIARELERYQQRLQTLVHQSTQALAASEARLRTLFEMAPLGIVEVDFNGQFQFVNRHFAAMLGLSIDQLLGKTVMEITYDEDLALSKDILQRLQRGEQEHISCDKRYLRGESWFWGHLELSTVKNAQGEPEYAIAVVENIHERKLMEESLRQSEARFQRAQSISHMGSWEWDAKANRTIWSDEVYRIFERPVGSIQPNYEVFMSHVHPDDRPIVEAEIQGILAGESITNTEYRAITAKGNVIYVREHCDVLRNEAGEITHTTGSIQDITPLRQATLALQASEARLANSQAIAHVANWEGDLITNAYLWSDEFYRIFDLEPQSVQPSFELFFSMVDPGDRPIIEQSFVQLRRGETVSNLEYRINTAQGRQKIVVEHTVSPRLNEAGELIHVAGTLQDITEFKRTLNALKDSETRFRELVEHIDECFWINLADPSKVIYVSPAYERIWGRSCASLLADGSSWIESVHPEDREQVTQAAIAMAEGADFNEEYRIVRPDGTIRWIHARSAKIFDEAGTLLRHVGVVTDMTQRKQFELDLRASESRFRGIFDQAALGIAQVNLDGDFYMVNQAFSELVGYSQGELNLMKWQDITHPDDVGLCLPGFEELMRGDAVSFTIEKRYLRKDGVTIWVKAIASFVYDANNQPEYLLALVEDITAYKAAQAALTESQGRYQELVEGIPAIVYQYSTSRGGIFYSSHLQSILGYDPAFMRTQPHLWHDSIHPEDVHRIDAVLNSLEPGKNFEFEYRIQDAAGNWLWFYDCSFCIQNIGGELIVDGFALDITQRKYFDTALRHRLSLETVLADISHLMITKPDLDLTEVLQLLGCTFQADRMSVMLGQADSVIVERFVAWAATPDLALDEGLQSIDMSPYAFWLSHWQEQRSILVNRDRPLPETAVEERAFLEALSVKAVMWTPIKDHQGQPWGYIECSTTDPHHMLWSKEDADLLAIAGDLIYNYCERQKARHQLETAKEAAEAANRAKNQFLTNMSHELRTPLNAILGFTQLMEQSKIMPDNHREHLAIVRRSGKHLLTLLNDILNLAKFEKGTLSVNPTLFNLHALLDDLENMYLLEAQRKNLQFVVRRDKAMPRYITADQAKLHSVLIHLLSNAVKFTDIGSVQLSVEVMATQPFNLRFSVIDTGIGIQDQDVRKLFDNFVKLEAGDRLGQGSGLGLALSQKLVNLMGSEIVVSSRPEEGSCFSFELPCGDSLPSMPMPLPSTAPHLHDLMAITAEDLQSLPSEWREAFYQAALAARATQLEQLIDALPDDQQAIARALRNLLHQLEFEQLAALSQSPPQKDPPEACYS